MDTNFPFPTSFYSDSTESLLFEFLKPQLEKVTQPITTKQQYQQQQQQQQQQYQQYQQQQYQQYQQQQHKSQQQLTLLEAEFQPHETSPLIATAYWDDTLLSIGKEDIRIVVELESFSDLQAALKDTEDPNSSMPNNATSLRARAQKARRQGITTEERFINLKSQELVIPAEIRLNVESSQMLDMLMNLAVQHWCCVGFKVAPIHRDLILNWRMAPLPIVYCIASISLVTFMEQQKGKNNSSYFKQVAMAFYEQARNNMDDILFDDMQPIVIQSYFCLSYTSNLLRLYEQQRTWGGLASISLQHMVNNNKARPLDDMTLGCWFRWYYIDAWMCLTLNRDCLLPDVIPWMDRDTVESLSLAQYISIEQHYQYCFANLTQYMRQYIRALHSGKLFSSFDKGYNNPSRLYYEITKKLTDWYAKLHKYNDVAELHLNICYHSMRIVVLYQFLSANFLPVDNYVLVDTLQTNFELIKSLQELKEKGCDQSTYHHMFFAIHNTARRVFQYNDVKTKHIAEEQLKINLAMLMSSQAFGHDVFKMQLYAKEMLNQFQSMNIVFDPATECPSMCTANRIHGCPSENTVVGNGNRILPLYISHAPDLDIIVFRQQVVGTQNAGQRKKRAYKMKKKIQKINK